MGEVVNLDDVRRARQAARAACFICELVRLALLGLVLGLVLHLALARGEAA